MITSIKDYTVFEKRNNLFKDNFSYSKVENNIIKKQDINFYFLKNYTIAIKSLYLFVDKLLLASSIDTKKDDLVVLVLYCLSYFENEKNISSKKLLDLIQKKELEYLIKPIFRCITHLFSLFNIKIKKPIYKLKDIYNYNVLDIFVVFVGDSIDLILSKTTSIYDFPEFYG